ncbi:hypothetical protein JB92DRAFT_3094273 [Gautieria morchelliformis]|nr:hypothetical protein JB92DRAFT_3094273 [Gautieria morchelliformis]
MTQIHPAVQREYMTRIFASLDPQDPVVCEAVRHLYVFLASPYTDASLGWCSRSHHHALHLPPFCVLHIMSPFSTQSSSRYEPDPDDSDEDEQDDREVLIKVGSITTLPCPFSTLPSSSRNEPDPDDDTLCDRVSECCSSHRDPPVASYPYDEYEWDNCEVLIKAGSITTLSWPFSTLSSSRYEPDPDDSTAGICCGIERQQGRAEEVDISTFYRYGQYTCCVIKAPEDPTCQILWWRLQGSHQVVIQEERGDDAVFSHFGFYIHWRVKNEERNREIPRYHIPVIQRETAAKRAKSLRETLFYSSPKMGRPHAWDSSEEEEFEDELDETRSCWTKTKTTRRAQKDRGLITCNEQEKELQRR